MIKRGIIVSVFLAGWAITIQKHGGRSKIFTGISNITNNTGNKCDSQPSHTIALQDGESIKRAFGNCMTLLRGTGNDRWVMFQNLSHQTYFKMRHNWQCGDNCFDFFEVGSINKDHENSIYNESCYADFLSETGVTLGMKRSEVIHLRQYRYWRTIRSRPEKVEYFVSGTFKKTATKSIRIKYSEHYYFKNESLVKFAFGIENYFENH